MLDSLVRVSRRVGQVTDRFATDPEPTPDVPVAERPRSAGTDDSPRRSNGRPEPSNRRRPRSGLPRSADGPTPPRSITPNPCGIGHLPGGLLTADEPVVAFRPPKVHPSTRRSDATRSLRMRRRAGRRAGGLNPTGGLCGPLRLPLNGFTYC
jgi:hypothetical protein